jgi:hypothetical protein
MPIMHSIRKWLQESPHSPTLHEPTCGDEASSQRRNPVVEFHVYRSCGVRTGTITEIYYSELGWGELSKDAAYAAACILQCEALAAYKAFLSNVPGSVPYLHVGDIVIQFSDITALRVLVQTKKAHRQKAIDNLQDWQREALGL